jgi:hypothetical protein
MTLGVFLQLAEFGERSREGGCIPTLVTLFSDRMRIIASQMQALSGGAGGTASVGGPKMILFLDP